MQEVATSSILDIFTVKNKPAVIGDDETRVIGEGETTVNAVIGKGDRGSVRVDDPQQLRTHVLTARAAYGTASGLVIREHEAGDDPS
jgi:hypothetical protein